MVNCPTCGAEMRLRGYLCRTSTPVYRCANCGVDHGSPKEVVKPPKTEEPEEKIETTKKTRRKKKDEDEPEY